MRSFAEAVAKARHGSHEGLAAVIRRRDEATDEDLADLALALAESGETLDRSPERADVASTGGPTSLTTVLAPVWLAAAGAQVPALAVPGRAAGGIDAVGTLPNYHVDLGVADVNAILARCRYAHFVAGAVFAPLDAALFALRQQQGAQASGPLAIASLLSKKVAVGVSRVGLDVRVAPHGNFGATLEQAEANADRFRRVAYTLGMTAQCWLTDANTPYQPWIGRGETLAALHLAFTGVPGALLASHMSLCGDIAATVWQVDTHPTPGDLRDSFAAHLDAQGSSWEAFERRAFEIRASDRTDVMAAADGYMSVDLGVVRDVLVAEHRAARPAPGAAFPDPAGLVLTKSAGTWVTTGEVVARVRAHAKRGASVATALEGAFLSGETAPEAPFGPRRL